MSNDCKYEVSTKHGELLIVDEPLDYEDAKQLCEGHSASLAPLNSNDIIQDISSYLGPCNATGYHGTTFPRSRDIKQWTVGLETYSGYGTWSDGADYNETEHGSLFGSTKPSLFRIGCKTAYLEPTTKLLTSASCSDARPFVCMRMPIVKVEKEDRATHLFIIGLAVICIVLLLFHLLRLSKHLSRRGKKKVLPRCGTVGSIAQE